LLYKSYTPYTLFKLGSNVHPSKAMFRTNATVVLAEGQGHPSRFKYQTMLDLLYNLAQMFTTTRCARTHATSVHAQDEDCHII
jgi:hypothetical protein